MHPPVTVSRKAEDRIQSGHLWIYSSDVTERGQAAPGSVVRVLNQRGKLLGTAHYSSTSQIVLRMLSRQAEAVDRAFLLARLQSALAHRKRVVSDSEAYRLVHADGDLLPGLIADVYGDYVVLQLLDQGMDALKAEIVSCLEELLAPKAAKKGQTQDLTGSGRVLLVEDEDVVRSFAVRALKRQGYEVLEASTGVEALEVMQAHNDKVDIVVSDVVMPEMDGPTLLKELRKKNPHLKIIFVSGYPHEAFETSLDKNEQFAFLPKPFSLPQLAAKVKEQLAR